MVTLIKNLANLLSTQLHQPTAYREAKRDRKNLEATMFKRLEQSRLLVSSQKIELLADKQLLPNEAAHQLYHVTLCRGLQTVLIFDVLNRQGAGEAGLLPKV
jgi:hypothetical protein